MKQSTGLVGALLTSLLAVSGCVNGGACLFMQPVRHTLTGRIHFREFPAADGVDHVPVLVLDQTAYVYSPAHSFQCLSATDLQLTGVSEFPQYAIEDSRVSVTGALYEATAAHEYTRFLLNVQTLLPLKNTPPDSTTIEQSDGPRSKQTKPTN